MRYGAILAPVARIAFIAWVHTAWVMLPGLPKWLVAHRCGLARKQMSTPDEDTAGTGPASDSQPVENNW